MGCPYKLGGMCKHDDYHGEVCSRLRPMICPMHNALLTAEEEELAAKQDVDAMINNR